MYLDLKEFIAIGDLEGRFDKLRSLLLICPDVPVISVGDAHDRGRQNRKTLEFFMNNPNAHMVQSNHTHLLLDFYDGSNLYDGVGWLMSGGKSTLFEFGVDPFDIDQVLIDFNFAYKSYTDDKEKAKNVFFASREKLAKQFRSLIDPKLIDYLRNLPFYIETSDVIVTHAPINPIKKLVESMDDPRVEPFLWNVWSTRRRDKYQIHGHVSLRKPTFLKDKRGDYGINIDSSRTSLSAFHWPSKEVFSVELDPKDHC